jgi:hypothetical protein
VVPLGKKVLTNQMPKEIHKSPAADQEEELTIIKICSHCEKHCTNKNHKRDFGRNRKVTKHYILKFNKFMTKSRQRKKQVDDPLCEKCYGEFMAKVSSENRALNRKLALEIEKNENIDAEEPETEEGDFKEDGTLTNTFLQAIVGNLLFQIQISKN